MILKTECYNLIIEVVFCRLMSGFLHKLRNINNTYFNDS